MTQTTPFTAAEIVDIRRFCGYPSFSGIGLTFPYDPGVIGALLLRMTDAEMAVVRVTYLPTLGTLETDIPAAATNLGTDSAAVWKRNKDEISDRAGLFTQWRNRLCGFLGIPPGPELFSGNKIIRV